MQKRTLSTREVLAGYDAISHLYPNILPLCIWRAWEFAAYQNLNIKEPVLDFGCGDGQFFRLLWPNAKEVIGLDSNYFLLGSALKSGTYHKVCTGQGQKIPFKENSFNSVLANCSIEHMNNVDLVINEIYRCMRKGGLFIASIVTDKIIEWTTLPLLISIIGEPKKAEILQNKYIEYHNLVNPLSLEIWIRLITDAGFEIFECTPIVPEMTSRFFLFLDHLWHVDGSSGEVGSQIYDYLNNHSNSKQSLRKIYHGILDMDNDWSIGSGAIIFARRCK